MLVWKQTDKRSTRSGVDRQEERGKTFVCKVTTLVRYRVELLRGSHSTAAIMSLSIAGVCTISGLLAITSAVGVNSYSLTDCNCRNAYRRVTSKKMIAVHRAASVARVLHDNSITAQPCRALYFPSHAANLLFLKKYNLNKSGMFIQDLLPYRYVISVCHKVRGNRIPPSS